MNGRADDSSVRNDDLAYTGEVQPGGIVVVEKLTAGGHQMPEAWLRARVRGWMNINESPGLAFWIGTYTAEGKWIYCSSNEDRWLPAQFRIDYAMRVAKHLNQQVPFDGAWLVGWVRGGREFYLLWKDKNGDIQIPIECDKPFVVIRNWLPTDWEHIAATAHLKWVEWQKSLELTRSQQKMVAQGEAVSPGHFTEAPQIGV